MYTSPSVAASAGGARGTAPLDAPAPTLRSISDDLRTHPGRRYGQLESISGNVRIAARAIVEGAATTSGDIQVHEEAAVGPVRSISGNLTVGAQAWVRRAETVSGHIALGLGVEVEEGVQSTSGTIKTDHGCRIKGDVTSTIGDIVLLGTEVEGDIHVVSGDLTVTAGSRVSGNIHLDRPASASCHRPRIVIGPDACVEGELLLDAPVDLFVHATAQTGPIMGASRIVYSTPHPPQAAPQPGLEWTPASPLETVLQALAQRAQMNVINISSNTVSMSSTSDAGMVFRSISVNGNGSATITDNATGNVTHLSGSSGQNITIRQPR